LTVLPIRRPPRATRAAPPSPVERPSLHHWHQPAPPPELPAECPVGCEEGGGGAPLLPSLLTSLLRSFPPSTPSPWLAASSAPGRPYPIRGWPDLRRGGPDLRDAGSPRVLGGGRADGGGGLPGCCVAVAASRSALLQLLVGPGLAPT
jgi:hypothetical protein